MATNVFVIENNTTTREGVMALIELDGNIFVAGSSDKYELNTPYLNNSIDVLLIELNETFSNVISLIRAILQELPKLKIIILSGHEDSPTFLKEAFEVGVSGYMTKNASAMELSHGIDKVNRDGLYICTAFMLRFINSNDLKVVPELRSALHDTISANEMQVLKLIAEGLTNNDIAQKLCVSVRTIETRRYKLQEKTNTNNTASLIRYCFKTGLIN